MKIGDKIVCKKVCIMFDDHVKTTTVKKVYTINSLDKTLLFITDDQGNNHSFGINKKSLSYYGQWFTTLKDDRRKKLKKIAIYSE
jgi:hypothetical protein